MVMRQLTNDACARTPLSNRDFFFRFESHWFNQMNRKSVKYQEIN